MREFRFLADISLSSKDTSRVGGDGNDDRRFESVFFFGTRRDGDEGCEDRDTDDSIRSSIISGLSTKGIVIFVPAAVIIVAVRVVLLRSGTTGTGERSSSVTSSRTLDIEVRSGIDEC